MIAPLRRRHRLMTTTLAVAVPVLYFVALGARPEAPIVNEVPAILTATGNANSSPANANSSHLDQDFGQLFEDPLITVRSRRSDADGWVELEPSSAVALPEVLVYWASSSAADRLPADSYLIGSLAGARTRTFQLPESALGRDGSLVLYSLGHQQVVASASLPAIGQASAPAAAPMIDGGAQDGEGDNTTESES